MGKYKDTSNGSVQTQKHTLCEITNTTTTTIVRSLGNEWKET